MSTPTLAEVMAQLRKALEAGPRDFGYRDEGGTWVQQLVFAVNPESIRLLLDALEEAQADARRMREALRLIEHATSPAPDDGGFHEAAYDIARAALAETQQEKPHDHFPR